MEKYQFEFCGIGVELRSERPIPVEADLRQFLKETEYPDLTIACSCVETLLQSGTLLGSTAEMMVYQDGPWIRRYSMASKNPYAMLAYQWDHIENMSLEILQKDWKWAAKGLQLWVGACFPVLLRHFDSILVHASYIDYQGQGILFTAPSQTGKSTQAELWRAYRGAEIINGDKAGISICELITVHSVPFSGTSHICKNRSLPLKAIVVLSQAKENMVRRLPVSEATSAICQNAFVDRAVAQEWPKTVNLLLELASSIPVYALACTPDVRAVETLEQALI